MHICKAFKDGRCPEPDRVCRWKKPHEFDDACDTDCITFRNNDAIVDSHCVEVEDGVSS